MSVFSRVLYVLVALPSALASAGCCGLATYFCGPDRSRWVSRDYATPEAAIATLLEAIRRDMPDAVYQSLSEAAKDRYGIPGVVETTVAWQRLKREVPGLHMMGTATTSAPTIEADGRARFEHHVAGRTFTTLVVQQAYWDISYVKPGADGLERQGRFVTPRRLSSILVVDENHDGEVIVITRVEDPLLPQLDKTQIREVRIGYTWRVDEIRGLDAP
ncbi:MAG: hypothetical protein R3F56_15180 [Planctomycetota bacterium]